MSGETQGAERRTVVESQHWICERCSGRYYLLIERGIDRDSWCLGCYDGQGRPRR